MSLVVPREYVGIHSFADSIHDFLAEDRISEGMLKEYFQGKISENDLNQEACKVLVHMIKKRDDVFIKEVSELMKNLIRGVNKENLAERIQRANLVFQEPVMENSTIKVFKEEVMKRSEKLHAIFRALEPEYRIKDTIQKCFKVIHVPHYHAVFDHFRLYLDSFLEKMYHGDQSTMQLASIVDTSLQREEKTVLSNFEENVSKHVENDLGHLFDVSKFESNQGEKLTNQTVRAEVTKRFSETVKFVIDANSIDYSTSEGNVFLDSSLPKTHYVGLHRSFDPSFGGNNLNEQMIERSTYLQGEFQSYALTLVHGEVLFFETLGVSYNTVRRKASLYYEKDKQKYQIASYSTAGLNELIVAFNQIKRFYNKNQKRMTKEQFQWLEQQFASNSEMAIKTIYDIFNFRFAGRTKEKDVRKTLEKEGSVKCIVTNPTDYLLGLMDFKRSMDMLQVKACATAHYANTNPDSYVFVTQDRLAKNYALMLNCPTILTTTTGKKDSLQYHMTFYVPGKERSEAFQRMRTEKEAEAQKEFETLFQEVTTIVDETNENRVREHVLRLQSIIQCITDHFEEFDSILKKKMAMLYPKRNWKFDDRTVFTILSQSTTEDEDTLANMLSWHERVIRAFREVLFEYKYRSKFYDCFMAYKRATTKDRSTLGGRVTTRTTPLSVRLSTPQLNAKAMKVREATEESLVVSFSEYLHIYERVHGFRMQDIQYAELRLLFGLIERSEKTSV